MAAAPPTQLNVDESPSWGSRTIECFEKLEQIGEGTYGQVYMAKEKRTGEIVALKKIRMDNEKEGFPITAIREIKILKKLHHENVIKLKEIITGCEGEEVGKTNGHKYKGSIYMVFEYMDHDLTGLLDRPGLRFTIPQIKCYMKQLLTGLHYCHVNQILHRDIKGSNLLIDNKGNLKLADFGLARSFSDEQNANLTNRVITLWYRPPELLLGATKYGTAVDLWSVGCIFAELLNGKPIIQGKSEPEQLSKIFELCGTPDEINWPGVSKIPWYYKFKPSKVMKRRVREVFRHFDRQALDLLDKLLTLDPAKRITAKEALNAEYFKSDPLPCDRLSLPTYETSHEFQTKKKRQQQRKNEEVAKKQKLQHPQQHVRLPPIQQQQQPRHWVPPDVPSYHPFNNAQPPPPPPLQPPQPVAGGGVNLNLNLNVSIAPHHQYGRPPVVGPNRYPGSGGYYHGGGGGVTYAPPPPPQAVGMGVRAPPPPYLAPPAPRGGVTGGYGPPNFAQTGHYGGSGGGGGGGGGGRGSNQASGGGNRNQQYGWQQQQQ